MLKRLAPLWPSLPVFGWFFLGWTMLAHASTGTFAFSLFGYISKWLDAHAWAGFLVGLSFLAAAVFWPEIEKRLPNWLKEFRTPSTRLKAIECEHLPNLRQVHEELEKRIDFVDAALLNHGKLRLAMQ